MEYVLAIQLLISIQETPALVVQQHTQVPVLVAHVMYALLAILRPQHISIMGNVYLVHPLNILIQQLILVLTVVSSVLIVLLAPPRGVKLVILLNGIIYLARVAKLVQPANILIHRVLVV